MPQASVTEQNLQARLDWLQARSVWWAVQMNPQEGLVLEKPSLGSLYGTRPTFNIRTDGEVLIHRTLGN